MRIVACTIDLGADRSADQRAAVCEAALRPTVAMLPGADGLQLIGTPDDVIEAAVDAILAGGGGARVRAEPLGDATDQDARHVAAAIHKALAGLGDTPLVTEASARRGAGRDPLAAAEPFLEAVAAATPLPAGGSCAALTGASAAALVEMAARLTIDRAGYEAVGAEMVALADDAARLRVALHDIVRRDTEAYQGFMAASRLPRSTDAEFQTRRAAMSAAALVASEIPLETMRLCADVLEGASTAARKGNRNVATDAAVAAVLAGAAGRSAWMNVRANLPAVKDIDVRAGLSGEAAALHAKIEELSDRGVRASETRDD